MENLKVYKAPWNMWILVRVIHIYERQISLKKQNKQAMST